MLPISIPLDRNRTKKFEKLFRESIYKQKRTHSTIYQSYHVISLPSSVCTALSSAASKPYTTWYNLVKINALCSN